MFDVAPTELLLVAVVALLVIGPKDLPHVLRVLGRWVAKARNVASQFRSGFDEMIREAELKDMEEKWRAENEKIMRDYPTSDARKDDAPVMTPLDVPAAPEPPVPPKSESQ